MILTSTVGTILEATMAISGSTMTASLRLGNIQ